MSILGLLLASWLGFEYAGRHAIDWSPLPEAVLQPGPGLLLTRLALALSGLVALLNYLVMRYARRYLASDRAEAGFFRWSQVTIGCVLLMILSNNFVLLLLAWLGTSLGLHKLLTLYKDRPAARRTAALKFMISRIGDAALVIAALLVWQQYQSFHFPTVMAAASAGQASDLIAALLVMGALTKSAQVPFHAWLPETIDTPTPVSALMHAGIINAGGFLLLRAYPLVAASQLALSLLCLFGLLSIVVAGLTMLATPDVKRQLAHGTSAQMGFMFVQIGFGLPSVALAHMIAHAFYKAYAFLSSGELGRFRQRELYWSWGSHAFTAALVLLALAPFIVTSLQRDPLLSWQQTALLALFILLVGSGLGLMAALARTGPQKLLGFLLLPGAAAGLLWLSHGLGSLLLDAPALLTQAAYAPVLLLVVLVALGLFVLQRTLPQWPEMQKQLFLTHARHGFYIPALGQSIMRKLGYV